MTTDLLRQLADYGAYHEETQEAVEFEEIELRAAQSLAPLPSLKPLSRRPTFVRRGLAIAGAAALIVALLIGTVAILQRTGVTTDTRAPVATPTPPPVTEATPTVPPAPEQPVPTEPPATAPPTTAAPAGFNEITWTTRGSVPIDLLDQGFPRPGFTFDAEMQRIYAEALCCLEIYRTGAGYLGLRDTSADTKAFVPPETGIPELGVEGRWFVTRLGWNYPTEVWFSADGSDWDLVSEQAFAPGSAVLASDPFVAAEREGTWMVIGAADAGTKDDQDTVTDGPAGMEDADLPRDATPALWVSDDLTTWIRISDPFAAEGTRTRLTSVAASDRGWVVFGVRVSEAAPYISEWVGWFSKDGIEWGSLPVSEQLGDAPPCANERPWRCSWLQGAITADSVVVYAWTWDLPVFDWRQAGWRLLIGDFEASV